MNKRLVNSTLAAVAAALGDQSDETDNEALVATSLELMLERIERIERRIAALEGLDDQAE